MLLTCNAEVKKVKKKSQSPAFVGLNVGDVICFSIPMESVGRNNRTYAAMIHCYNTKTKKTSNLSFNQIGRVLNNFEFNELIRHLFSIEEEC